MEQENAIENEYKNRNAKPNEREREIREKRVKRDERV